MVINLVKYVIDTHALIWFLEGNPRLGDQAKQILSNPNNELVLSAIALAEAIWIVGKGKTSIPTAQTLLDEVNQDARVVVYPLDKAIIEVTLSLPTILEMHDRQIVATAKYLESQGDMVSLLTCDQNITSSNLVTIVW